MLVERSSRYALLLYWPKGTDLSVWSEGELDVIAGELNDRLRKTLDWDTSKLSPKKTKRSIPGKTA